MIKEFDQSKIDHIMKIWLEENIKAHDFIPKDYWENNYEYVKKVLPDATAFVYEENNEIKEFIGIIKDLYIARLFVSNKYQSKGIGENYLMYVRKNIPL